MSDTDCTPKPPKNRGGAPLGNQNARKPKEWQAALKWALKKYERGSVKQGMALREIAMGCVERALAGDEFSIKEIGNRLDGKPATASQIAVDLEELVMKAILQALSPKDDEL